MGRVPADWHRLGASNGCGKVAYATRKAARLGTARIRDRERKMRPYRCDPAEGGCGWWHNGHLPGAVRRGELTADEAYGRTEIEVPHGQRPIDMTMGILTPRETAARFRVQVKTVYEWARAYQANNPDCTHVQLAAFHTPGGEWRFSVRAVNEALARQADTTGQHDG